MVVEAERSASESTLSEETRARIWAHALSATTLAPERQENLGLLERAHLRFGGTPGKRAVAALAAILLVLGGGTLTWSQRSPDAAPIAAAYSGGDPLASFAFAGTLPMLVNGGEGFPAPDLIVQGRVTGASGYQVAAPSLPPKPGLGIPGVSPWTAFTFEVSDIIVASLPTQPGMLTVTMRGTPEGGGGADSGFPLLEVGGEYLLFLVRQPDGTYQTNGGPQGYLRVKGGKAEPVAQAPVIDQFAGKDVAEVKRQVKGAKQK